MTEYKIIVIIEEQGKSIFSHSDRSSKGLRKNIVSDLNSEKIADDVLDYVQDNYKLKQMNNNKITTKDVNYLIDIVLENKSTLKSNKRSTAYFQEEFETSIEYCDELTKKLRKLLRKITK